MTGSILNSAEVGDSQPVILPQKWPSEDFSNGVGSPCILYNADDDAHKLLFTGWSSSDGSSRHLFVADIDGALNVTNPSKIEDAATLPTGSTVTGASGIYDPSNNEWIVAITTNVGNTFSLARYSADFSIRNEWHDVSGTSTIDSSAAVVRMSSGDLALTYVENSNHDLMVKRFTTPFTSRPISAWSSVSPQNVYQTATSFPDVHHTRNSGWGWVTVAEFDQGPHWNLRPMFQGKADSAPRNAGMWASERPLIDAAPSDGGDLGHPYYTTELGRPLMFFDVFRSLSQGTTNYRHELHAIKPEWDSLTPHEWLPMRARVLRSSGTSKTHNTFQADKMILVANVSGACDVNVNEGSSWSEVSSNGNAESTTVGSPSSSGTFKFVHSDPAPAAEFEVTANCNYLDVFLR